MSLLQNLSIRRKLMVIIMTTTMATVLLASVAFFVYDAISVKRGMARSLGALAETLHTNTTAALAFNDPTTAEGILAGLAVQPHVVAAAIYKDGKVFADYLRPGVAANPAAELDRADGDVFVADLLVLHRTMRFGNAEIGQFQLVSDLQEIGERRRDYLGILGLIVLGSAVIAFAFSSGLQQVVSKPILHLVQVEKHVTEKKDFGVRAKKHGNDELGHLIDGFNEMLSEIQIRDQELSVARDRAEQANRSKSAFLANMSHELRTPLTAIIGYSEILEDDAEEMGLEDFLPDLRKIQAAGKHLLGLINSILDLSKVEAGKMELHVETFDVRQLVNEVSSTVLPLMEKSSSSLEVRCPESVGTSDGDLTKTRQILFNLLSNASKFTQEGQVTLEVERRSDAAVDWLVFRVTDTGIGMSEEQLSRLFQPFTQADSSTARHYGGTGLGLALCKHFTEALGGRIRVKSEPGKGSTFTVYLPAKVDPERKPAKPAAQKIVESGSWPAGGDHGGVAGVEQGRLVLVVDDDPAVHDLLRGMLAREGFRVATASSGEEAMRRARNLKPDIITLDVNLPGSDGWSILSSIKSDAELADTPVIMLTVSDEKEKGFALGASEFLTKPIDRRRLAAILARFGAKAEKKTVLVVDDDPNLRSLVRKLLEEQGWQVGEAENGLVALRRVADEAPGLILLDLMMPEMDGFAFLAQLRKNLAWRSIPVVVLTAMDLGADDRKRLNGGVERVLQKGALTMDELKAEIRSLARGSLQS